MRKRKQVWVLGVRSYPKVLSGGKTSSSCLSLRNCVLVLRLGILGRRTLFLPRGLVLLWASRKLGSPFFSCSDPSLERTRLASDTDPEIGFSRSTGVSLGGQA